MKADQRDAIVAAHKFVAGQITLDDLKKALANVPLYKWSCLCGKASKAVWADEDQAAYNAYNHRCEYRFNKYALTHEVGKEEEHLKRLQGSEGK